MTLFLQLLLCGYFAYSNHLCQFYFTVVQCFLQAGADVNGKGTITSPLLIATEKGGHTNFIRLLLKAGADLNIPDDVNFIFYISKCPPDYAILTLYH